MKGRLKVIWTVTLVLLLLQTVLVYIVQWTVSPSSASISVIANYACRVGFDSNQRRNTYTIRLPAQLTTLSNTSLILANGTVITSFFTISGNTISFNNPILDRNLLEFTLKNIKNPQYALTLSNYLIATDIDASTSLSINSAAGNAITYNPGPITDCRFSFSGVTEQPQQNLTVTLTTVNPLTDLTRNLLVIGFPRSWPNLLAKTLLSSNAQVTCFYALGSQQLTRTTCSNSWETFSGGGVITVEFSEFIPSGSYIRVVVQGVDNPPTQTVDLSSFTVGTYSSSVSFQVDSAQSVALSPLMAVNTVTNGVFVFALPPSQEVSATYPNPIISLPSQLFTSLMRDDILQVTYIASVCSFTCPVSTVSIIQRMGSPSFRTTWLSLSSSSGLASFRNLNDSVSTTRVEIYLGCQIRMPPSTTSALVEFTFKRQSMGSYARFLVIQVALPAIATALVGTTSLSLTDTTMLSVTDYTFSISLSKPLSQLSSIEIIIPSSISLSSFQNGCSLVTASRFTLRNCRSVLNVRQSVIAELETTSDPFGFPLSLSLRISSLTNPGVPDLQWFGVGTYYANTDLNGITEYKDQAVSTTYGPIRTLWILTPSTAPVYARQIFKLSSMASVLVPAQAEIKIVFPVGLWSVDFAGTIFLNNTPTNVVYTIDSVSSLIIRTQSIAASTLVAIPVLLTSPSQEGVYAFPSIQMSSSGQPYEFKATAATLVVAGASLSPNSYSIVFTTSKTGVLSQVMLTITMTVPHPEQFLLQIDLPEPTTATNLYCNGCQMTQNLLQQPNNSTLRLKVTHTIKVWTIQQSIQLSFGLLPNPRTISARNWEMTTKTVDGQLITRSIVSVGPWQPNSMIVSLSSADYYFRNNPASLRMTLTVTNILLTQGEYFIAVFPTEAYIVNAGSSISCFSYEGLCSVRNSLPNELTLQLTPHSSQLGLSTLSFSISGLISSSTSSYLIPQPITVSSFSLQNTAIDRGSVEYRINCSATATTKSCRTCDTVGNCNSCYTEDSRYLFGDTCVLNCSSPSSYSQYGLNGICVNCVSPCISCFSATSCLNCSTGFYLRNDQTCSSVCSINAGQFISTVQGVKMCLKCTTNCVRCFGSLPSQCLECKTPFYLQAGSCVTSCSSIGFFKQGIKCDPCDPKCLICSGPSNDQCTSCRSGYYLSLGISCVSSCPSGSAKLPLGTCGCSGQCKTCLTDQPFSCSSCVSTQQFILDNSCVTQCPSATYLSQKNCVRCQKGCSQCTQSGCLHCQSNYFINLGLCVDNCSSIAPNYNNGLNGQCIVCAVGCQKCTKAAIITCPQCCQSCANGYVLANQKCIKACLLDNSCDRMIVVPGTLSLVTWGILVGIAKALIVQSYLPYCLLVGSAAIQHIQSITTVATDTNSLSMIKSSPTTNPTRLLQAGAIKGQLSAPSLILIVSILLTYCQNFIFVYIFFRQLVPSVAHQKPSLPEYLCLGIGVLIDYRLALLMLSHLVPRPHIPIDDPRRLHTINCLCILSALLQALPIAAGVLLAIQYSTTSTRFMLGIDLIIVSLALVAVTGWAVAVPKSQDYYEPPPKVHSLQENHLQDDIAGRILAKNGKPRTHEQNRHLTEESQAAMIQNTDDPQFPEIDDYNERSGDNEAASSGMVQIEIKSRFGATSYRFTQPCEEQQSISPKRRQTQSKLTGLKKFVQTNDYPFSNRQSSIFGATSGLTTIRTKNRSKARQAGLQLRIYPPEDSQPQNSSESEQGAQMLKMIPGELIKEMLRESLPVTSQLNNSPSVIPSSETAEHSVTQMIVGELLLGPSNDELVSARFSQTPQVFTLYGSPFRVKGKTEPMNSVEPLLKTVSPNRQKQDNLESEDASTETKQIETNSRQHDPSMYSRDSKDSSLLAPLEIAVKPSRHGVNQSADNQGGLDNAKNQQPLMNRHAMTYTRLLNGDKKVKSKGKSSEPSIKHKRLSHHNISAGKPGLEIEDTDVQLVYSNHPEAIKSLKPQDRSPIIAEEPQEQIYESHYFHQANKVTKCKPKRNRKLKRQSLMDGIAPVDGITGVNEYVQSVSSGSGGQQQQQPQIIQLEATWFDSPPKHNKSKHKIMPMG